MLHNKTWFLNLTPTPVGKWFASAYERPAAVGAEVWSRLETVVGAGGWCDRRGAARRRCAFFVYVHPTPSRRRKERAAPAYRAASSTHSHSPGVAAGLHSSVLLMLTACGWRRCGRHEMPTPLRLCNCLRDATELTSRRGRKLAQCVVTQNSPHPNYSSPVAPTPWGTGSMCTPLLQMAVYGRGHRE